MAIISGGARWPSAKKEEKEVKPASSKEISTELKLSTHKELVELCLRLARFKKENKELLTYLLFESDNETSYINAIKQEIDEQFSTINTSSYYFIKKSVRKILRNINKYNRYTNQKETEVELLIYFCKKLKEIKPSIEGSIVLKNIFENQLKKATKISSTLHEDLQRDYGIEVSVLNKLNKV